MSLPKSRRQCTFKFQRVLSAFPVERLPELLPEELLREVLGKHKCLFGGVFHSAIVYVGAPSPSENNQGRSGLFVVTGSWD